MGSMTASDENANSRSDVTREIEPQLQRMDTESNATDDHDDDERDATGSKAHQDIK